jgi:diguanylate cyclase (GGDEF)-like protein
VQFASEILRLEAELDAMRARMRELERCAERDPLTDLLNRRGFEREFARASAYIERYGGRAALIYLDLDRFKGVNDTYGHPAGDAVLKAVARTLLARVRASDIVARLGGDEFAVVLWNLSDRDARAKAEALEQAVAATVIDWAGSTISVGASAGLAALAERPRLAEVLSCADAAMYARKRYRSGRGAG